ncbi:Zinc finger homeobox protein 3 [Hypsizygus marmoreus]|uniref:Zinc finger homeobox protein 3 n=1 Tax=Hypsizygus marmoreus TaxID=39966 RepID=A0A369K640_HYPMA|nr:Zinc finger homeobox protein 3 [Hypsizygus marmoreus]
MQVAPPSLSRTSSTASISSSDDAGGSSGVNNNNLNLSRRTRKRFTNAQLTMLENLFHQNSHPSREERDVVARLGGMETKSVTIWFQNKRQTERKVAAINSASASATTAVFSFNNSGGGGGGGGGRSHSLPTSTSTSRLSLDSVASRSELPMRPPRTPTRPRDPNAALWDNMPSSPIAPPFSPPMPMPMKATRTLEWACAAARMSDRDRHNKDKDKEHRARSSSRVRRRKQGGRESVKMDWTDEDTDEAITPPSTMAGGDVRWTTTEPGGSVISMEMGEYPKGVQDDDMMKAALTLCGLGRR